jgi:hypothetical protein
MLEEPLWVVGSRVLVLVGVVCRSCAMFVVVCTFSQHDLRHNTESSELMSKGPASAEINIGNDIGHLFKNDFIFDPSISSISTFHYHNLTSLPRQQMPPSTSEQCSFITAKPPPIYVHHAV